MMTYRLYYCDRDNRVTHFTTLESADDLSAIEQARRLEVIPGMSDAETATPPRGQLRLVD